MHGHGCCHYCCAAAAIRKQGLAERLVSPSGRDKALSKMTPLTGTCLHSWLARYIRSTAPPRSTGSSSTTRRRGTMRFVSPTIVVVVLSLTPPPRLSTWRYFALRISTSASSTITSYENTSSSSCIRRPLLSTERTVAGFLLPIISGSGHKWDLQALSGHQTSLPRRCRFTSEGTIAAHIFFPAGVSVIAKPSWPSQWKAFLFYSWCIR